MDENKVKKGPQESEYDDGEFMLEPVPVTARRSTKSQFMVWIGFGYAVTGLIIGGTLGGYGGTGGMPPAQAMLAVILGMGALYLITWYRSSEDRFKSVAFITLFLWL